MAYFTREELKDLGFKSVGNDVKISTKASIYNHDRIAIGDHSRIDDFCLLSGNINIGRFVHIAAYCNLAGGEQGITMEDFSGFAYGVQAFTQSDDYSGNTLTNPTVPDKYKNEVKKPIIIKKHALVGTYAVIMPGVVLQEGTSVGAMTLIRESTEEWSIYAGNPAKKIIRRSRDLLVLEKEFLNEIQQRRKD